MSIYVGNLPFEVDQEDVVEVFKEYGEIKRVHFPMDRETKRKRGFAFVEMETPEQEAKAIAALDGAQWMGRCWRRSQSGASLLIPDRNHSRLSEIWVENPVLLGRLCARIAPGCQP